MQEIGDGIFESAHRTSFLSDGQRGENSPFRPLSVARRPAARYAGRMTKLNFEILAYDDSPLGLLCLRRRELLSQPGTIVTEVTLNHEFLMSSLYTDSERMLSSQAIEMHGGQNLKVLVGGLGLGYTANAAIATGVVDDLNVIEFLPQVIQWMQDGLVPLSDTLNNERRFRATRGDVYQMLADEPSETYDVILIDVDHSPDDRLGEGNSGFYTEAGLSAASRHLSPAGVLGVWSYAEDSPFVKALENSFREVRVVPVTHENQLVGEQHTDWLFFAR